MTNDDRGGKNDIAFDEQLPRARQNVIWAPLKTQPNRDKTKN